MSEQQITLKKQRLPFTQVPNELLCSNKISGMAKALWCVLYSKPENWTFYWSEISKNFCEGREALMNARRKLEEAGFIKITQKRISTGKGDQTRYGGMDIELFHTPSLPLDLEPKESGQTTGFPTSDFPTSENQSSEKQISDNELPENPPLDRNKSNQDLSKQNLSNKDLSLSTNPKFRTLEECLAHAKEKNYKINVKEFHEYYYGDLTDLPKMGMAKLMMSWAKKPENYFEERPITEKKETAQDSEEIKKLRSDMRFLLNGNEFMQRVVAICPIEKTLLGFVAKVEKMPEEKVLGILSKLNVRFECQKAQ